jgi:hypothetical protein
MLIGLGLLLLWSRPTTAQPVFVASDYIFRITAQDCTFIPKSRVQTGFQVQGIPGIVTALHGVADCNILQAKRDNGNIVVDGLTLAQVDVVRDVAVLAPSTANAPGDAPGDTPDAMFNADNGLEIAANVAEDYAALLVIGYPGGRTDQQQASRIEFIQKESLSRFLSGDPPPTAFLTRSSPQKEIDVLTLEADMVPGHSGAPLLTGSRAVLGIIDGGLRQGAIGQAWAIPWQDLDLRPVAERASELQRLRDQDPQLAFLFSTTLYRAEDYGLVESNPVNDDTFAAFRHFFDLTDHKVVEGEEVTIHTIFEGVNNEPRGQRSLLAAGDLLAAAGQMGYFHTGDRAYALLGELCVQTDTTQFQSDLDALYAQMRALIAFPTENATFGTLLGEEAVDGVPTRHYLLDSGSGEWAAGEAYTLHNAEIWTTVDGDYLVRLDFDFSYNGVTFGTGRMRVTMMLYGLNTDPQVELPAACLGAGGQATATAPATPPPTRVPTATPTLPTPQATHAAAPTRRIRATPTPAVATPPVTAHATLGQVWLEHNQVKDGETGMVIHADFAVQGMRGQRLAIWADFLHNGIALRDRDGEFAGADGEVAVGATRLLLRDRATYADFTLFMPYRQLDLSPGVYELTTVLRLWNVTDDTLLADSAPLPFTYSLPPAGDDAHAPTALVNVRTIDYNGRQDGVPGMYIHLHVHLLNLKGRNCQAVVYFEYAEGGNLQDFDGVYQDSAGQVVVATTITPADDNHVDSDLTLFMPYAQLHMLPGTYDLRLAVRLYDHSREPAVPIADSDYVGFTYTQAK